MQVSQKLENVSISIKISIMSGVVTVFILNDISILSELNGKWGRMETTMDFIKIKNRQKINITIYSFLK